MSERPLLSVHELPDHRREDELHGERHLPARADNGIGPRHEGLREHRQQIGEIDAARIAEADDQHALVWARHVARDERVRGIDCRHSLEIYVGSRELRADVVHVVGHPPEDRINDRLLRVAAMLLVAVQLLDPFEIDDRYDADEQVGMARDVHRLGDHGAVQPLVEQHVGPRRQILPRREGAGLLPIGFGLLVVMQILAHLAGAALAVGTEQRLDLLEEVSLRAEMAEALALAAGHIRQLRAHLVAVKAMEGVALDDGGGDALATEYVLERRGDRGGAGARRPGDRDDGMLYRHGYALENGRPVRNSERVLKSGVSKVKGSPRS